MKKNRVICVNTIDFVTFAVAMQSINLLNINLAQAAEVAKRLDFTLADRFFADLEQEEISGGEICLEVNVKRPIGNVYKVGIKAKGYVVVACDRCLDPLRIDVDTEDTVKIKDAEPEENDAVDMLYIEANDQCYDLSWQVYEIIETSLPMQRVHPDGDCNPDMMSYIMSDATNSEEDEDDD